MTTTRRILVHTDFSDASVTAVHYARLLADGLGATLDFIHVLQGPFQAGWTAEVSTAALPEVQQAMEVEAEQWLDRVLPEAEQARYRASLHFETGEIATEICRFVGANHVDIVVVSATAAASSEEADLGVAADVLERCPCSVFVVRQPES
ncbi:MAG: universal stress protein [Bacteroidales bacterium]